ncbi:Leukocyte receptor cluster member 1 [Desmophyllum pertusum]|uniref:Leukocyte receptor cluster member 1 n=1 Tax=Desmophyllum pertusum TaxID=174260 RepID=A0A9W9ZFT2_9CNID|nr:Leukocyte receptor cluster member 1 [Desmophyllum pertusum]
MNILPKKSWHVRNIDNVQRVRRDEENARLEEKERERRKALAEQEARTALLRGRATKKQLQDEPSQDKAVVLVDDKPQHLNLFADIEQVLSHGSNREYEAEKKAEQEKREKAIGLLTYLGQSTRDTQGEKPWYVKSHQERSNVNASSESSKESDKKKKIDPLQNMTKFLEAKKSHKGDKDRKHKGKHRKHNKTEKDSKQKKSVEEMRKERLRREQEEHERERKLLASARGESNKPAETECNNDRAPHRYNSQYNPDFARRPGNDRRYKPY